MEKKWIRIGFPNKLREEVKTFLNTWYASGTTSEDMDVTGVVLNRATGCKELDGDPCVKAQRRRRDGTIVYCWRIRFKGPIDTTKCCTLQVTSAGAPPDTRPVKFLPARELISVTSHNDGDDITDELDNFSPYGGLEDGCLATQATLTRAGSVVPTNQSNPPMWVAEFGALDLPPGTDYNLDVLDDHGHPDHAHNLKVT